MSTDSYTVTRNVNEKGVTSYETEINREIRSHSPTRRHAKSTLNRSRPRPSDEVRRMWCVAGAVTQQPAVVAPNARLHHRGSFGS